MIISRPMNAILRNEGRVLLQVHLVNATLKGSGEKGRVVNFQ